MATWLVKSDPETYGLADLERDRSTVWDGVANPVAQKHLRAVRKGDPVFVYHSGAEKAIVGLATAKSDAYPDPKQPGSSFSVVDLAFVRRLQRPVTLASIKSDAAFAAFELVRMSRLSVMPVPEPLAKRILRMAGES